MIYAHRSVLHIILTSKYTKRNITYQLNKKRKEGRFKLKQLKQVAPDKGQPQ